MHDIAQPFTCPDCRPEFGQTQHACTKRECPMRTGFAEESLALFRQRLAENAPPARQAPERGWVLERGPASGPAYLAAICGTLSWEFSPNRALRFARREDAEAMATVCFIGAVDRIAEHEWDAPESPCGLSAPSSRGGEA